MWNSFTPWDDAIFDFKLMYVFTKESCHTTSKRLSMLSISRGITIWLNTSYFLRVRFSSCSRNVHSIHCDQHIFCPLFRIFDLFLIRQLHGNASAVFQQQNFRSADLNGPKHPTFNLLPPLKTLKSQVSERLSVYIWRLILSTKTFITENVVHSTWIKNKYYETFVLFLRLQTQRHYKYSMHWVFKTTALSIYLYLFFHLQFSAWFVLCTLLRSMIPLRIFLRQFGANV